MSRTSLLYLCMLASFFAWSLADRLAAAEFYISPSGTNTGDGSIDSPWGTFDHAIDQLNPGDTLYVRGGTYHLASRIRIRSNQGGTEMSPIQISAAPGESPVLDFSSMSNSIWGSSSGRGLQIDTGADYIYLKGLTVQNARDNGIWSGANHGLFEQTVTRWNGDSGLQLADTASYNLILNADSYENYDPSNNGENADGFAIKFENLGPGNVVRGARAWGNADDGWDMWESTSGGVLVEDSWAYDNGKVIQRFFDVDALEAGDLTANNFSGDGNGFKLGHDGGPHVLNRVVARENAVRGIDINGNGFGVEVNNSAVYNSGRNWQFDETADETLNQHLLRNNISLAGSSSDIFLSGVSDSFNTWNGIPVGASDFLSLDDTIARGPRLADGSLPTSDFLRLVPDSNLVDAGIDVGLPFTGKAPDLGAFERDLAQPELLGDYNDDGVVDLADYTVWRDHLGQPATTLPNGLASGTVGSADYLAWREQFGAATPGPLTAAAPVPEPGTLGVLLAALGLAVGAGRLATGVSAAKAA